MINSDGDLAERGVRANKRLTIGVFISLLLLVLLYWHSFQSMVLTWWTSSTYVHGFVIFPISAYLIWVKREKLFSEVFKPTIIVAPVLIGFVFGWFIARLAGILIIEQFIVVAMIPIILWQLAGKRMVAIILFPLAFLFFAVPFGEFLVPHLQDFTAIFTVNALRLSGLPVYMEGRYFYIPSGSFEVAKACSGIRYLIASVTLGVLFTYVYYRSIVKRTLYMVFAIMVPLIANGIRAYGIVMIAHFSDYKLAVGVDHIIYGGLFFGLIIFLMFWVGLKFSDQHDDEYNDIDNKDDKNNQSSKEKGLLNRFENLKNFPGHVIFLILIVVSGPIAANLLIKSTDSNQSNSELAVVVKGWQKKSVLPSWQPHFVNVTSDNMASYVKENAEVQLYIANYKVQQQGRELINSENRIYDDEDWQRISDNVATHRITEQSSLQVRELIITNSNQSRIIWYWYDINGVNTINQLKAKYYGLKSWLSGGGINSSAILISARYQMEKDEARQAMVKFLADELSNIQQSIRDN